MKRTEIKQLYRDTNTYGGGKVTVAGWVRTLRSSKAFGFIELNDGSFFKNVQVVFEEDRISNFKTVEKLNVGSAIVA